MDHALAVIKRLCRTGRIVLTAKAEIEMDRDGLTRDDVIDAILSAPKIAKRLRSTNPQTGQAETLYVIPGTTRTGLALYTKGKISREPDGERFYVLISSKRFEP